MEGYIGEIRMFAGNFAPYQWAICDGSLLPIAQNNALFAVIGTTYGGNGTTTFAVPDMRGRVPVHCGAGPGLANVVLGEKAGNESTTLLVANIPAHTHTLNGVNVPAASATPSSAVMLATTPFSQYVTATVSPAPVQVPMNVGSIAANTTTNIGMSVVQPFTAISFIIALQGIFPSRD